MTRLERKKDYVEPEISFDIFGLIDGMVMDRYYLTEDQYDELCAKATDEEISLLMSEPESIDEARKIIETINRIIQ